MGLEFVGGRPMYRVWGCGTGKDTSALFELDMAARVAVAVWYVDSQGGSVHHSEGYRPTGSESPDRFVTRASQTSLGMSTQWFQVGRMDRGETPSAIIPRPDGSNASAHNRGRAWDSNAPTVRDMQFRAEGCALVGLVFNVPSESWHCEPLGAVPSAVDLAPWIEFVQGVVTPTPPASPQPNNRLKEAIRMFLVTQSSTPAPGQHKRTFIMTSDRGAVHLTDPAQVTAWQKIFAELGLKGPGFEKSIELPWDVITHASEGVQGKNAKA